MSDLLKAIVNPRDSFSRADILVLLFFNTNKSFSGSQTQLGDILNLERKAISRSLKQLEQRGLIRKQDIKRGDSRLKRIVFVGGKND